MQGIHDGFVKLFCRPGTGIVVGGVVVAPRASRRSTRSPWRSASLTVDQVAHGYGVPVAVGIGRRGRRRPPPHVVRATPPGGRRSAAAAHTGRRTPVPDQRQSASGRLPGRSRRRSPPERGGMPDRGPRDLAPFLASPHVRDVRVARPDRRRMLGRRDVVEALANEQSARLAVLGGATDVSGDDLEGRSLLRTPPRAAANPPPAPGTTRPCHRSSRR